MPASRWALTSANCSFGSVMVVPYAACGLALAKRPRALSRKRQSLAPRHLLQRFVEQPAMIVIGERPADRLGRHQRREVGRLLPDFLDRLVLGDIDLAAQSFSFRLDVG